MPRVPLVNEQWGFETNCFVCEPKNGDGLRIPFFHDTDADVVVAEFNLPDSFSGAPAYVHGGISLAVLDEATSWATIALGHRFAVTTTTTTTFERPVLVGRDYRVTARLLEAGDEAMTAEARISFGDEDKTCATTTATLAVLSAATATGVLGADVTGTDDEGYLRS